MQYTFRTAASLSVAFQLNRDVRLSCLFKQKGYHRSFTQYYIAQRCSKKPQKYAKKVCENKQRQFAPLSIIMTNLRGGWRDKMQHFKIPKLINRESRVCNPFSEKGNLLRLILHSYKYNARVII